MTDSDTTNETPVEDAPKETSFSQSEVDKIVSERLQRERAKFEGYDEYKTRAEQAVELSKRIEVLEKELSEASEKLTASELKALRVSISAETSIPVSALTASTEEELRKQAEDLQAWRGETPGLQRTSNSSGNSTGSAQDAKARAADALRNL